MRSNSPSSGRWAILPSSLSHAYLVTRESENMKVKEKNITSLDVLIKGFRTLHEYIPHTITRIQYKHKNKPALISDSGEKIERWWISDVLLDTPETREIIKQVKGLNEQVRKLQREIRSLKANTITVDTGKLHERIIVSTKR